MFVQIWEAHETLQEAFIGKLPQQLEGDERALYFKDMTLAATNEAHEALDEVGWKPWASSRHFNEQAVRGELIDELHFLLNRMMAARMTPDMIREMYFEKNGRNLQRIERGYDGVTEKCPGCKRAIDDPSTHCQLYMDDGEGHRLHWCQDKGFQQRSGEWAR